MSASWVHGLDARQRAMLFELGLDELDLPAVVKAPATSQRSGPISPAPVTRPAAAPPTLASTVAFNQPMARPEPAAKASGVPIGPRANAQAVALMDWAQLKAEVGACQACGLCEGRQNTVFGVGAARPDVLIVGEAPGQDEDRLGEPFVGRAGALLDLMLGALGLSRHTDASLDAGTPAVGAAQPAPLGLRQALGAQRVYIANTLKCRPPGNRNPTAAELAQCTPLLHRQIALLQPKLIVASGRFAIDALLVTDEPVGKLRGRIHAYRDTPVVVTYHPSYLLRTPSEKAKAWDDWCLVAQTLGSGL
jgi:uracil-DNA glycosylase